MLRQMERSAIQVMAKRGKSVREIARELGRSPSTIARVLKEPVDRPPASRNRGSRADPFRAQIERWLAEGLTGVRMLELARGDPEQPYRGGRSVFNGLVRRIRQEREQERRAREVPIRFEGLPAEYLQVDWGEVRRFPFLQQAPETRYFLACRLKYSRWVWLRWTGDMRGETLFRGLVDCFGALGFVPWVLVFDNMKTVTSGRDETHAPVWTPALLKLAAEFGFHPQACTPGAANQKGSVESLVRWVKGNFLAGRSFGDDADLAAQSQEWQDRANQRPCQATDAPPVELLARERAKGGPLPATAADYGLLELAQVSAEALVAVRGNRYSVPVRYAGMAVAVRLHRQRVRIWQGLTCLAGHPRAADGAHKRVIDPDHFAPQFGRKPRARVMLYRAVLWELGPAAEAFVSGLSYRYRAALAPQVLAVYALYREFGAEALLAAMCQADRAATYSAEALRRLLILAEPAVPVAPLALAGVPAQCEVDRPLSHYEALVEVGP
jgi:transposase